MPHWRAFLASLRRDGAFEVGPKLHVLAASRALGCLLSASAAGARLVGIVGARAVALPLRGFLIIAGVALTMLVFGAVAVWDWMGIDDEPV